MLRDGVLLLGFALAFVLVFRRFRLGATLGYLIAGAVVGPQVLGLVGDAEQMITVAELGIVMLLFVVGLELDPARLWRMKTAIFGLGTVQVVACGLAISAVIYFAASYPLAAALAIGLPLGLSSTAQVLPMLQSSGRLRTPFGERAFAILLFQDLSIIPLITIVAAMSADAAGSGAGAEAGMPGWQLAIMTLAAIAGLIAAGRFLLRPLFRLIGNLNEREMFVVAVLFTVLGSAFVMEWLGLSTALGAFIAGVMLADTPYRHELEADIEPFRSILLGMFFLAVGMMLDLNAIAENPLFVVAMAIALIVVKTLIILGIGLAVGMAWRGALALGLLLSQGGEFGFVLFTQAQEGGLISSEVSSLFGAIVTLSMATTPFLMMAASRMRTPSSGAREGPAGILRGDNAHALVIGFGRFGQTVAQLLVAAGVRVTLVDSDVGQIDAAEEFGSKVYYGDGTRLDLLRQAGAGEANIIVFAIDRDQLEPELLHGVREAFPDLGIYVRAYDRRTLIKLGGAPIDHTVREVLESAVTMGRAALDGLGVSLAEIDRAENIFRERDEQRLEMQLESGDLRAAKDMIFTQQAVDAEALDQPRDNAG